MGSSGQSPGQMRGSRWCLDAWVYWKGQGGTDENTLRLCERVQEWVLQARVQSGCLAGALACSPHCSDLLYFSLFKLYPNPRCDWMQKPTSGTNPSKWECTTRSHFSLVIRTRVTTAGWGSVGLLGLWTTVSSWDICNKNKPTLNIHWKDWWWSWSSNTLATWCEEPTHWKRSWCWERLKAGGEGGDRGWDG